MRIEKCVWVKVGRGRGERVYVIEKDYCYGLLELNLRLRFDFLFISFVILDRIFN